MRWKRCLPSEPRQAQGAGPGWPGIRPALSLVTQATPVLAVCTAPQWMSFRGWGALVAVYALALAIPVAVGRAWRMEPWWLALNCAFSAIGLIFIWTGLPPTLALILLLASASIMGPAATDRVPLFLSNASAARAIGRLARLLRARSFVDLGAGLGTVSYALAQTDAREVWSIERSPVLWLLLRLRSALAGRPFHVWRGDLFGFPLGQVDLAYAFLSPAAMPRLLEKAAREMRPGTWLISNSFGSADWPPDRCIVLRDRRRTHLYLWRLPRQTRRAGSASEAIDQND